MSFSPSWKCSFRFEFLDCCLGWWSASCVDTMWNLATLQFHLQETPDAIRTSSPPLYFDFTPRSASLHSSFMTLPLFMDTSALAASSWSEPRLHISREDSSHAYFIESVSVTMLRGIRSVFSSGCCRRCCATAVTKCDLLQVVAAWPVEGCTHNGLLADAIDGTSTAAVFWSDDDAYGVNVF